MKRMTLLLTCLLAISALAVDNLMPDPLFKKLNANGIPENWSCHQSPRLYTFKDGTLIMKRTDGQIVAVYYITPITKPATDYVFTCKLKASQPAQVKAYYETTCENPETKKQSWSSVSTSLFNVGTAEQERILKFTIPAQHVKSSYLAFIAPANVTLTVKDMFLREILKRPTPFGGYWDLENQIEVVDDGIMSTDGKPGRLIGVPVQPGKAYSLKYTARGIGSTGNDYPFHPIIVRATNPQYVHLQGGYFFNDVRNEQDQPKEQKITIPANSGVTKVNFTFNANTKGKVHFFDFSFTEYIPDPRDNWRLFLDEPFYRDIIFESCDAGRIIGHVDASAPAARAVVTISSVGKADFAITDGKGTFSIPAQNLKNGKYTLTCVIYSQDGKELKTLAKTIARVPKAKSEVIGMPNRYFNVNGKPFFPVNQWSLPYSGDCFEACLWQSARNGINCCITNPIPHDLKAMLAKLDMFHKYGFKVICNGGTAPSLSPKALKDFRAKLEQCFPETVRNHPAFLGYFMIDEPLWGGKPAAPLAASLDIYKDFDPYHPAWINAAPRNEPEDLIPYGEACDIYGVDIYPIPTPNAHSGLDDKGITSVGKYTSRMADITFWRKPIWMALQGFSWAAYTRNPDYSKHIYPDDTQMRFMAYDTMFNGCTSYGLWGTHYIRNANFFKTIHNTTRELHALSGLFVYGTQEKDLPDTGSTVRVIPVRVKNNVYYAVMNTSETKDASVTFAPETGNAPMTVYATGASVTPKDGKVTLSLKPLEVMLFGKAPLPEPVYALPAVNQEFIAKYGANPIFNCMSKEIEEFKGRVPYKGNAYWIWEKDGMTKAYSCALVGREFTVPKAGTPVILKAAADDSAEIYLNGEFIGKASNWNLLWNFDLTSKCKAGKNTLIIKGMDGGGLPCGILAEIRIKDQAVIKTDASWLAAPGNRKAPAPATLDGFKPTGVVCPYGQNAWGSKVQEKP